MGAPKLSELQQYGPGFDRWCAAAQAYWPKNVRPDTDGDILVELFTQDVRVWLRQLTLANAIRRERGGRIVVLTGPDPDWRKLIWDFYDQDHLDQLATAYGASDIIDVAAAVEHLASGAGTVTVCGVERDVPQSTMLAAGTAKQIAEATALRILHVPRLTPEVRAQERCQRILERCRRYERVLAALVDDTTAAVVVSHVDYHQWAYLVEAARRHTVPVFHVQSTGCLKTYAWFGDDQPELNLRQIWTLAIAEQFERDIWPRRDLLLGNAELTAWRARANLNRPAWWRGGGAISQVGFRTSAERASLRRHTLDRLGFDPAKPVVAVFDHAVSDACWGNTEIFADLADWLERTAEFAARHPEANWLFVDHPSQHNYDSTGHFEKLAASQQDAAHVRFVPSLSLSKNALWSLVDLAVTVRGSVSNEFPAFGVPAIQAGWSEWSHCGFTMRADIVDDYWAVLTRSIEALRSGERLIDAEQVERARLWLWWYRAATDVPSPLVPQWELLQADELHLQQSVTMNYVESDADPVFTATHRLLTRHDPALTRVDLQLPDDALKAALATVPPRGQAPTRQPPGEDPNPFLGTAYDDPVAPATLPVRVAQGGDPALRTIDGVVRGQSVAGRFERDPALMCLAVGVPPDTALRVVMRLSFGPRTDELWQAGVPDAADGEPGDPAGQCRDFRVICQGRAVFAGSVSPTHPQTLVQFDLSPDAIDPDGLLVIEVAGLATGSLPAPIVGVQIDWVRVEEPGGPLSDRVIDPTGGQIRGLLRPGGGTMRLRVQPRAEPTEAPERPPASPTSPARRGGLLGFGRRPEASTPQPRPDARPSMSQAFDAHAFTTSGRRVPLLITLDADVVRVRPEHPVDEPVLYALHPVPDAWERLGFGPYPQWQPLAAD